MAAARYPRPLVALLTLVLSATLLVGISTAQVAGDEVRVIALSNRADLISGGDVFLEI